MSLIDPDDWQPVGIPGLEPEALAAVRAFGNTLVTAGPGAGKTELLGQRGVFLLQTGLCLYPRRLLAISFKRDAARNLRERFQRRCTREQAGRLDSMTFDAFAKLLLDRFRRALAEPWDLSKPYRISKFLSGPEFNDFQRSAADNLGNPAHPAGWASAFLGRKPRADQIRSVTQHQFNLAIHDFSLEPSHVRTVGAFLQLVDFRRAFMLNPVPLTFPMIGRLAQRLVDTNPQIRAALLATYSNLFLDEFQDTTGVQYGLMKSIFHGGDTVITAVGDDKQKIMGWAGAQKDGFRAFEADFLTAGEAAGQRHITLPINYRSNARIVEILNIIKRKLAPHEPDFRAARPAPQLPPEEICAVIVSADSGAEARCLASHIAAEIARGLPPREIGLLVRQMAADWERNLAPVFAKCGVWLRNEDRDVGGASIQDLMTEPYAQSVTEAMGLLLRRRGGSSWIHLLDILSDMEGISPDEEPEKFQELVGRLDSFHAAHRIDDPERPAAPDKIEHLLGNIEDFLGLEPLKASAPHYQQGDYFETVRAATRRFLCECAAGGSSWQDTLARYRGEGQVPLMTITKSKGLEYDLVIILGLDDDQWWSFQMNPQEGHSTFFVAASRARERLLMTLCKGKSRGRIQEIYDLLRSAGVRALAGEALSKAAAPSAV